MMMIIHEKICIYIYIYTEYYRAESILFWIYRRALYTCRMMIVMNVNTKGRPGLRKGKRLGILVSMRTVGSVWGVRQATQDGKDQVMYAGCDPVRHDVLMMMMMILGFVGR